VSAEQAARPIAVPSPVATSAIRGRTLLWAGIVTLVLVLVAVAMRWAATTKVAPYLPFWADQVQYLTEAYRGYDHIRANGLIVGTYEAVRQPRPQGWLIQTLASLHMLLVGPGRVAALDVNLAALMLWLATTAYAMKRLFGISASLVTLGLILSTQIMLSDRGGPFDFRLDFAAMCLWGTLVALLVATNGQFRLRWAVVIAGVGCALIATRFIAASYLLPFGGMVTLFSIVTHWKARRGIRRFWTWTIPVVVVWTVVFAVILTVNFELFLGYYIWGHVTGSEVPIRRLADGLLTFRDDLVYYPRSVLFEHLTRRFDDPAAATLLLAGVAGFLLWRRQRRSPKQNDAPSSEVANVHRPPVLWALGVASLGLFATYLTLTVAQVKSEVVAGPIIPPIVLGVISTAVWLSRAAWDDHPVRLARLGFRILGPAIIVVALLGQSQRLRGERPSALNMEAREGLTQIVDDATPYLGPPVGRPRVWSIDGHYVEISSTTVQVLLYERTGAWMPLAGGLGHGPLEQRPTAAELLGFAEISDVLILAQHPPAYQLSYPYDQAVYAQHEILEQYAEQQLTLVKSYDVQGTSYFLYVRPVPGTGPPR
jgi:hypothetical protein